MIARIIILVVVTLVGLVLASTLGEYFDGKGPLFATGLVLGLAGSGFVMLALGHGRPSDRPTSPPDGDR